MQRVNGQDIASYNWPRQLCVSALFFELNGLVTTLRLGYPTGHDSPSNMVTATSC